MAIFNGAKLKSVRESLNKTQVELADAADTTDRYVRSLESGEKKDPSASIVYGFAIFLEIPMEELMTVITEHT